MLKIDKHIDLEKLKALGYTDDLTCYTFYRTEHLSDWNIKINKETRSIITFGDYGLDNLYDLIVLGLVEKV